MIRTSFKQTVLLLVAGMIIANNPAWSADDKKPKIILTEEQRRAIREIAEQRSVDESMPSTQAVIDQAQKVDITDQAASIAIMPPEIIKPAHFKISARPTLNSEKKLRTIHVYPNQITTFTFTDTMGVAWPLKAKPLVGSQSFEVHYDEKVPGVFTLETTSKYMPTSLALLLEGRVKPVLFQLRNNGVILNHDVSVTVAGRSPQNRHEVVTESFNIPSLTEGEGNKFLTAIPDDAQRLRTIGDQQTKVWKWRNKCYVKTPHEIIDSGTPISIQSVPDNIDSVWVFESLPALIPALTKETGEFVRIQLISGSC